MGTMHRELFLAPQARHRPEGTAWHFPSDKEGAPCLLGAPDQPHLHGSTGGWHHRLNASPATLQPENGGGLDTACHAGCLMEPIPLRQPESSGGTLCPREQTVWAPGAGRAGRMTTEK